MESTLIRYQDAFVAYDSAIRPYDEGASDVWKEGTVEITEKLDGSQFAFGFLDGELCFRSKGQRIYPPDVQSMFAPSVAHILNNEHLVKRYENFIFYGEAMKSEKHNTIRYEQAPQNHIMLFGARDLVNGVYLSHAELTKVAAEFSVAVSPLLFSGAAEDGKKWLEEQALNQTKSAYGSQVNIEGVVVRNPTIKGFRNGKQRSFLAVKYVTAEFKEVQHATWKDEHTTRGALDSFIQGFRAPARWAKAVHRAREEGWFEPGPKCIGRLIASIKQDIVKEEEQLIKEKLFQMFKGDILRASVKEFPEWYKEYLLSDGKELSPRQ